MNTFDAIAIDTDKKGLIDDEKCYLDFGTSRHGNVATRCIGALQ